MSAGPAPAPTRKFLPRKIAPARNSSTEILKANRLYLTHLKECRRKNEEHLISLKAKKTDRTIRLEIRSTEDHLAKITNLIDHCLKKLHRNCCGKVDARQPRNIEKDEEGKFVCWDCKTLTGFRVRRSE